MDHSNFANFFQIIQGLFNLLQDVVIRRRVDWWCGCFGNHLCAQLNPGPQGLVFCILNRARERRAFLLSVLVLPFDIFDELRDFVTVWACENDCADASIVGEVFSSGCASAVGAGDLADIEITGEVDVGFNDDTFRGSLSPPAHYDGEDDEHGSATKEHVGGELVLGEIAHCGNHEHESEKGGTNSDDDKEYSKTSISSHMKSFGSLRLLSFRVSRSDSRRG